MHRHNSRGFSQGFQRGMLRKAQGSGVWVLEEEGGTAVLRSVGEFTTEISPVLQDISRGAEGTK